MSSALPEIFRPVLAKLKADAVTSFGTERVDFVPDVWREHPYSFVLRLGVRRTTSAEPETSHVYVKITKPSALGGDAPKLRARAAHDFNITRRVYEHTQHDREAGAVRPVACYPDHLAIITEEVLGPTLLQHLETRARWFPSPSSLDQLRTTLAKVGRWIRVFQQAVPTEGHETIEALVAYVDDRLRRLETTPEARFTASDRRAVVEHLIRLGSGISREELRTTTIHGDLAIGNIIVAGARIVVLDFAMAARGTRVHDLTRLFSQLELLCIKPPFRTRVIRTLQQALVYGFDPTITVHDPLFRFSLLLHRVNHLTTLSVRRPAFAESVYNGLVKREHRRWLSAEVDARGCAQ
jgi:hypothetical protein